MRTEEKDGEKVPLAPPPRYLACRTSLQAQTKSHLVGSPEPRVSSLPDQTQGPGGRRKDLGLWGLADLSSEDTRRPRVPASCRGSAGGRRLPQRRARAGAAEGPGSRPGSAPCRRHGSHCPLRAPVPHLGRGAEGSCGPGCVWSTRRPRLPRRCCPPGGARPLPAFWPSLGLRPRSCPWPRRKPSFSPFSPPRIPALPSTPGTSSLSLSAGPFPSAFNTLQSLPEKASEERIGNKSPSELSPPSSPW